MSNALCVKESETPVSQRIASLCCGAAMQCCRGENRREEAEGLAAAAFEDAASEVFSLSL